VKQQETKWNELELERVNLPRIEKNPLLRRRKGLRNFEKSTLYFASLDQAWSLLEEFWRLFRLWPTLLQGMTNIGYEISKNPQIPEIGQYWDRQAWSKAGRA